MSRNASSRHTTSYHWENLPLDPTEAAQAREHIETLQDATVREFPEDADWRQRRIQFMNAVLHFELISDEHGLINFLDYQKLLTNIDELDDKTEQLTLMTLHAAKGTEFPVVIIIGMEEGSFPMWRQNITEAELEEERRLFYVGMTRAQEQLYLSRSCIVSGIGIGHRRCSFERCHLTMSSNGANSDRI